MTVTVYSPAASRGSTKKPASVVLRTVTTPVATLVAVTVASATTAPNGSVTVPSMEPVPPTWASALMTNRSAANKQDEKPLHG